MLLSIAVPCYNEENNVPLLADAFYPVAQALADIGFELILVDNGSKDHTRESIKSAVNKYPFIKSVNVEANIGYGFGIISGLKECSGEYIGWMHADMQVLPSEILTAVDIIKGKSYNQNLFIKGWRKNRPLLDTFLTYGMSIFETLYLQKNLFDINAQPTIIHNSFYHKWNDPPHDFSLDLYAFYMARISHLTVSRFPINQYARTSGNSSWNTGLASRIKLIRRVFSYSKSLKNCLAK